MRRLEGEEARLAAQVAHDDQRYAGLKQLDDVLGLVCTRFELALTILAGLRASGEPAPRLHQRARAAATNGLALLDELVAAGVSEDQRTLITEDAGYVRGRELFQRLVLAGGGSLFEPEEIPTSSTRTLARIVAQTLRKYAARDDTYRPLFHTERLPDGLRRLVNFFLPTVAWEGQADPPYGIEHEGEQETIVAERIKLPLSQAIRYFEEEILPALQERLAAAPGELQLQREIALQQAHLAELQRMRFIPRSTPIVLESGFYTEWLSGFTVEGEALISVPLRVTYRSGTNLDRMQDLIKDEITRRAAGKGISATLDAGYRHLQRIESGIRGSSRTPSLRLNVKREFQNLKQAVPALARLEDRAELRRLLDLVARSRRSRAEAAIEALLIGGPTLPEP